MQGSISVTLFGQQEGDQNKEITKGPQCPASSFMVESARHKSPERGVSARLCTAPFLSFEGPSPLFSDSDFRRNSVGWWD